MKLTLTKNVGKIKGFLIAIAMRDANIDRVFTNA